MVNKFTQTLCKLLGCKTFIRNFKKASLDIHRCFHFFEYKGGKRREFAQYLIKKVYKKKSFFRIIHGCKFG